MPSIVCVLEKNDEDGGTLTVYPPDLPPYAGVPPRVFDLTDEAVSDLLVALREGLTDIGSEGVKPRPHPMFNDTNPGAAA